MGTDGPVHTQPTGRRGLIALLLVSTLLSVVLVAAVGEWAVRKREWTRTTVPGTMSMLFYRHTRLMHGLVRGTDYFGWVQIGPQGFRGAREVSEQRPDSVFRIIAVGGSTTFDANTSGESAAWPARLEQLLNESPGPVRFEVLNAGVPGFQVFDDLVRLESELHRFEPDLLILYQGHNDLFNTLSRSTSLPSAGFEARPGEVPTVYPGQRWLERNSLLYHKLRSKWEAIRYQSRGRPSESGETETVDHESGVRAGARGFSRNVAFFLAASRTLDVPVLVPQVVYAAQSSPGAGSDSSITALWQRAIPFAPPPAVWKGYATYDSVARERVMEAEAHYVPASDPALWLLDGYAPGDPIHFNDEGAWRLARHLATAIRSLPQVRAQATGGQ